MPTSPTSPPAVPVRAVYTQAVTRGRACDVSRQASQAAVSVQGDGPVREGGGECICSYTPLYSPACLNNSSITRTPFSRTSGYKTKHNGTQVLFTTTSYSASVLQFFYKSYYSTVLYIVDCTTNTYLHYAAVLQIHIFLHFYSTYCTVQYLFCRRNLLLVHAPVPDYALCVLYAVRVYA